MNEDELEVQEQNIENNAEIPEQNIENNAEQVEQEINLAEELQDMALTVNAMAERINQLETSISVLIESGATVRDDSGVSETSSNGEDTEYLFLEDLDYNI